MSAIDPCVPPTADEFRINFPEFADVLKYSDFQFGFYMGLANLLLVANRWKRLLPYGLQLYVAHNLVLEVQAQAAAAIGGVPGVSTGAVASKAADKVSISYDTAIAAYADAGQWNLTTYGVRFWSLMKMVGAGPIQIGQTNSCNYGYDRYFNHQPECDPLSSANAWTGPVTTFSGDN